MSRKCFPSRRSLARVSAAPSGLLLLLLLSLSLLSTTCAWITTTPSSRRAIGSNCFGGCAPLKSSTTADAGSVETTNEDDDDEEYEYVEYDILQESDFVGSEWLMGTVWDNKPDKIEETWVRLVFDNDKNVAYWGDKSQGTWSLDVASQFLSMSKEGWLGKQIWATTVDDYYYLQGTVRGWTYWQPASVLAQWQAKRLGVDPQEAGTAPWFEEQEEQVPAENELTD